MCAFLCAIACSSRQLSIH